MAWFDRVPRVNVADGCVPKRVTLVYPYYQNRQFLAEQIAGWWRYSSHVRQWLSAIIVDDGSPAPATIPTAQPFPLRLFRINVDVRWNWLAARNIGAHHADEGWIVLTDMDHVIPPETARALVWGQHDPSRIYLFARREHTGAAIHPHSASYFLTRQRFWQTGGYDETLSGYYGTDGEFRRRAAQTAPLAILTDALVRYEYVGDASTTHYARKQPQDATVQRLIAARPKQWKPKTLSFPYAEIACCP